ncbi:MAG: protein-export chaperone SecB [Alphaproteobacteria bacterium]|nr:protein-export chaperone SecB [Alphaproteobacteria bacterium]
MANEQPALIINSQYIKDLSLELPHAPKIFAEIKSQPSLNVNINVNASHLEDNMYVVDLNLVLNGDINDKKLFILELTYCAAVTLNVPQEHLEGVLNIEIPRLIYPYARNVVTQCLMESGMPPIMLSPLDFAAIYEARKARQTADENAEKKQ